MISTQAFWLIQRQFRWKLEMVYQSNERTNNAFRDLYAKKTIFIRGDE